MKYMGSKNRLAKELVPIIQSYIDDNNIDNYLEHKIKCKNKYGSDNIEQLMMIKIIG